MHTYIFSTLVSILLLTLPQAALAASVISAEDSVAGIGTDIRAEGYPQEKNLLLLVIPPEGATKSIPITTDGEGAVIHEMKGEELTIAGDYRAMIAQDGRQLNGVATFRILPDALDLSVSSISSDPSFIQATGNDSAEITVTLVDQYENPLSGRPVELVSSRSSDDIQSIVRETGKDGTIVFTLKAFEPGTIALRALDLLTGQALESSIELAAGQIQTAQQPPSQYPSPYAWQQPFYPPLPYYPPANPYIGSLVRDGRSYFTAQTAGFDVISGFEIAAPNTLESTVEAQRVTIHAIDAQGRTVENYLGTVIFSSTDPSATLPAFGEYTFEGRDLGKREFPLVLTFETPGEQIFRVEDKTNPAIFGQATIQVTGKENTKGNGIEVTSHSNGQGINTTEIVLEGTGPPLANLIVTGGVEDVSSETNEDGTFVVPLSLPSTQRDFTIRVRDKSGKQDSGSLHLVLDTEKPDIGTISFSPENPAVNAKTLVVVESEPELKTVTLTLKDPTTSQTVDYALTENQSASGSYQVIIELSTPGSYQPLISVEDRAGNVTSLRTSLLVSPQTLPRVQNVSGESKGTTITLHWDPLEERVDQYRVYVGENEDDFLYTLDTKKPTETANVTGLEPAKTYYLAVTALKGTIESGSKDVVEIKTAGLALSVRPGDGSLLLEWPSLPKETPLHSFILEYGIEEGKYTEKRTIDGAQRTYTIRDLINSIPYYLRLTPISITGDQKKELAATLWGVPSAPLPGFHAAPSDPVPESIAGSLSGPTFASGIQRPHMSARTGSSPLPFALAGVIALLIASFYILHRRRVLQSAAFLQKMEKVYVQST